MNSICCVCLASIQNDAEKAMGRAQVEKRIKSLKYEPASKNLCERREVVKGKLLNMCPGIPTSRTCERGPSNNSGNDCMVSPLNAECMKCTPCLICQAIEPESQPKKIKRRKIRKANPKNCENMCLIVQAKDLLASMCMQKNNCQNPSGASDLDCCKTSKVSCRFSKCCQPDPCQSQFQSLSSGGSGQRNPPVDNLSGALSTKLNAQENTPKSSKKASKISNQNVCQSEPQLQPNTSTQQPTSKQENLAIKGESKSNSQSKQPNSSTQQPTSNQENLAIKRELRSNSQSRRRVSNITPSKVCGNTVACTEEDSCGCIKCDCAAENEEPKLANPAGDGSSQRKKSVTISSGASAEVVYPPKVESSLQMVGTTDLEDKCGCTDCDCDLPDKSSGSSQKGAKLQQDKCGCTDCDCDLPSITSSPLKEESKIPQKRSIQGQLAENPMTAQVASLKEQSESLRNAKAELETKLMSLTSLKDENEELRKQVTKSNELQQRVNTLADLEAKLAALIEENNNLKRSGEKLNSLMQENSDLKNLIDKLKSDPAKQDMSLLSEENQKLKQSLEQRENELKKLKEDYQKMFGKTNSETKLPVRRSKSASQVQLSHSFQSRCMYAEFIDNGGGFREPTPSSCQNEFTRGPQQSYPPNYPQVANEGLRGLSPSSYQKSQYRGPQQSYPPNYPQVANAECMREPSPSSYQKPKYRGPQQSYRPNYLQVANTQQAGSERYQPNCQQPQVSTLKAPSTSFCYQEKPNGIAYDINYSQGQRYPMPGPGQLNPLFQRDTDCVQPQPKPQLQMKQFPNSTRAPNTRCSYKPKTITTSCEKPNQNDQAVQKIMERLDMLEDQKKSRDCELQQAYKKICKLDLEIRELKCKQQRKSDPCAPCPRPKK